MKTRWKDTKTVSRKQTEVGPYAQVTHDPETGRVFARLAAGKIIGSEEVAAGIVVDYGEDGNIIAIEVDPAANREIRHR